MYSPFQPQEKIGRTPINNVIVANEIIPGLWLGSKEASESAEFLHSKGIQCIVNCTKDLPVHYQMENMRIPVDDNLAPDEIESMSKFLPYAASFIQKNYNLEKKPVLVHCFAGVQRSATVVAFYLSRCHGMPMPLAMELIVKRRPVAFRSGRSINFAKCLGLG